jgi:hypothetical protein
MIAEAIALISAGMQAFDLYAKYGGPRESVIQTLNLQYQPEAFRPVEARVQALSPTYEKLFATTRGRVENCINNFIEAIGQNLLPQQRQQLGNSARSCVCEEIKILRDFMREDIPDELRKIWEQHECGKRTDRGEERDEVSSSGGAVLEPA